MKTDEANFEHLYSAYGPAILAYALRRTNAATAQDVVGDTFAVAWRKRDQTPGEALPWLYGIARRVLANERRGSLRRLRLRDRLSYERVPQERETESGVLVALGTLSPREQETLLLTAWEGLTPTEAAVVMGCSANAFRIRLHRAKHKLEQALESTDGPQRGAHGAQEVMG